MSVLPGGHYHLTGVAGVGMSALAQVLRDAGCDVSGSDRFVDQGRDLEILRKLRLAGIRIVPQNGTGVTHGTRGLVVSTAIEPDNPDIRAAQQAGVAVLHRAELLAAMAEGHPSIAVTGTCGKSTVTGMVGWLLDRMGADPTVVNGAPVVNWMSADRLGSVRWGRTGPWVLEADESDRSLLRFHPTWAVITNASADHFSLPETLDLFRAFAGQVREGVVSGLDPDGPLKGFRPQVQGLSSTFRWEGEPYRLPLPGRHNAENALLAVILCRRLGHSPAAIREALAEFRGIHRRLELVGETGGITVIDDYAHNPAKIRASWETLAADHAHVHGVWRPHGYGPLRSMRDDLAAMFRAVLRPGDTLTLLPVFDAGGTADRSTRSEDLLALLAGSGRDVSVAEPGDVPGRIAAAAHSGDAVLVMGARDPDLPRLARGVLERLRDA